MFDPRNGSNRLLRKISEERRFHLDRGGSLKSRTENVFDLKNACKNVYLLGLFKSKIYILLTAFSNGTICGLSQTKDTGAYLRVFRPLAY
jgi:hypothetical protein